MRDPATRVAPEVAIDFAYAIICDMGMLGWSHWTAEDKNNEFKADRGRHANHHRDFAITLAVSLVIRQYEFKPTRNRSNHGRQGGESACTTVTAALARGGVLLDESAVEKIWEKQQRRFPEFFTRS